MVRIDADAAQLLSRLEQISQIHAAVAILVTLALAMLLLQRPRTPLAELLRGTGVLAEGDLSIASPFPAAMSSPISARVSTTWRRTCKPTRRPWRARMQISKSVVSERTEELRQANQSLRKIDETRRGFFADISHELRTPLTIIRGEGEIALRGRTSGLPNIRARSPASSSRPSICPSRQRPIIHCPPRCWRRAPQLQTIDLGGLIEKVCGDAKVIAHAKAVDISYSNGSAHELVRGDPARLASSFWSAR